MMQKGPGGLERKVKSLVYPAT